VRLERLEWSSLAATAHDLALLPVFRRTFSARMLRRGLALQVQRVALLFTDLTGSTDLYARLGDAAAFGLVDEHFRLLEQVVDAHGGAVVKTIGDAVMAAFATDADAVRGALAARAAFDAFRRERRAAGLDLKLGVHSGPCYVVTANGRLDYFGHTVNVAARLQGQAGPGEIVLSAETAARAALDLPGRPFAARLKGLPAPLPAVRIDPAAALVRTA
jgi:class 3 adenylate cyclase